jgi:hypothetical protein
MSTLNAEAAHETTNSPLLDAQALEAQYSRLMYGFPKTKEDLCVFNKTIMDMPRGDVVALLKEAKDGPFKFRSLLHIAREQYDGALRWIRKEYAFREDGANKNITLGTKVKTKQQPQQYRGEQGGVPAGRGVVEEADGRDCAKRAVGTTAAWRVRFDPVKPLEKLPDDEPVDAAHPALNWVVTRANRDGKPTERYARLPRLFWPDLTVVDYMSGPQHGARGRYEVLRRSHTNRYTGGIVAAEDTWEATGFAYSNLKDLWAYLQDDRDTRLGVTCG